MQQFEKALLNIAYPFMHIAMVALIVDDNKIARTTLKQLAGQVKDLQVAADFDNAMDACNFLLEQDADLLLLDIEMPGMSGLELTRALGTKRPVIIFTSSKKEYAAEAFDLNVADYIVKPITPARFIQAIERAREIIGSNKEEVKIEAGECIFIRDSGMVRRLQLNDILFAEAMGDYVKLHTAQKFYAVHATLKSVEERLPSSRFIRVHRSYIVAIDKIDSVQDGALVIQGKAVPVADANRAALNKRMNIL